MNLACILNMLTASGKDPNFPSSEAMDPPGTNSKKMLSASSSLAVPKYLWFWANIKVSYLKLNHSTQFKSNKHELNHDTHYNVGMWKVLQKLYFFLKFLHMGLWIEAKKRESAMSNRCENWQIQYNESNTWAFSLVTLLAAIRTWAGKGTNSSVS